MLDEGMEFLYKPIMEDVSPAAVSNLSSSSDGATTFGHLVTKRNNQPAGVTGYRTALLNHPTVITLMATNYRVGGIRNWF